MFSDGYSTNRKDRKGGGITRTKAVGTVLTHAVSRVC